MPCGQSAKPSVNLRFVFEGEEEAGSPHLAQYLAKYPKMFVPMPGSSVTDRSIKAGAWNFSLARAGRRISS